MDNKPQFVTNFIELYRTFPCLWKIKDECYHNRRLKDEAYEKMCSYYKTAVPSATIDTVKCKINNLKSAFRKELKKVKKQKSGSSADENYTSSLWYFDHLLFTADHEMPRSSIGSDSTVEVDLNETICYEAPLSPNTSRPRSPLPSPPLTHTQPSPSSNSSASLDSPLTPMNSVSSKKTSQPNKRKSTLINEAYKALKEDDEYDGTGLNIACKLRRMNEEQKVYAESLINKVILCGIRNRLQETTNITGVIPTQQSSQNLSPRSPVSQSILSPTHDDYNNLSHFLIIE